MLPLGVKGEKTPQQISKVINTLAKGNVKPLSRVVIYRRYKDGDKNIEVPTEVHNVLSYDGSEDRQFGASTISLTASNKDGMYSYGNIDSKYNELHLLTEQPESISVDLSAGDFVKTKHSGGLIIDGLSDFGEWTSDIIDGLTNCHSWHSASWDTKSGSYTEQQISYYSSIDVLIRYGNSRSVEDGTWTPWQKIKSISGNLFNKVNDFPLFSSQRFVQIRLRLYSAYDNLGNPQVISFSLKKNIKSDKDVISNMPLYYYGNRITIEECVITDDGEMEWFDKFSGFIDKVTPVHTTAGLGLSCTALDNMRLCLNGIIEKPSPTKEDKIFEPNKNKSKDSSGRNRISLVEVQPPGIYFSKDKNEEDPGDSPDIIVTEDDVGFVFSVPYDPYLFKNNGPIRGFENTTGPKSDQRGDHELLPWVRRPDVRIYVNNEQKRDGFDIDYEKGVVFFSVKPEDESKGDNRNVDVAASFEWYDMTTNLLEDVIGEIIALAIEDAGYTKPKKTRHKEEGYDTWESEDHGFKIILEHSMPRTTVPPIGFYLEDNKTYFDAIEDVLKYIPADYIVRVTPEGYFIGEHLPQLNPLIEEEAALVHKLHLVESMDAPVSENEIYTKCIARGVVQSTKNIARELDTKNIKDESPKVSNKVLHYSKPSSDRDNHHDLSNLVDGDMTTNTGWLFVDEEVIFPKEMIKLTLKKPMKLGAVNILIGDGAGHPGKGAGNKWGPVNLNGFGVSVEVSTNDEDWYTLTQDDYIGSSGEWIRIDKGSFLPDIKAMDIKYIRFIATNAPYFERGAKGFLWIFGKQYQTGHCWALRQIQVFPDEEIRVDVDVHDLIESLKKNLPTNLSAEDKAVLAKKIEDNLLQVLERVGTKTIILPTDSSLQTLDSVKARGLDYLYETIKNLYTSNVEVVYAPYIRMGHTVQIENSYLLDREAYHDLYYVDSVQYSMQGNVPQTRLSLVNWV